MGQPYESALEHLDDELGLISLLVERQIRAHWEIGVLPRVKDEFSGTFVSGSEVEGLFGGARPSAEGTERIAAVDKEIAGRARAIEDRLAASRRGGVPMPLDRLRAAFGLTATEQRALWVLLGVEISAQQRQLMRYLVNEASRVHADVGLLQILVYSAPTVRERLITELGPSGTLRRFRLIEPVGSRRQLEDAPFLLQPLRVSRRIVELAHGVVRLDPDVARIASLVESASPLEQLILPDEVKRQVRSLLALPPSAGQPPPVIMLSGPEGSGRKALAFGAARSLGLTALHVRCGDLPVDSGEASSLLAATIRDAILFHALPVFEEIDALGDSDAGRPDRGRALDGALSGFLGPVAATCGATDSRPVALSRGIAMVDLEVPPEGARAALWQRALGATGAQLDMDGVAARYPVTGGLILRAADAARSLARARDAAGVVSDADIHAGLRGALDVKLSRLGRRVTRRQRWEDLVLPEDSFEEVREFIARVKHRRRVYDEWGFSRKMAKGLGLSVLFAGPPGTGKTMVAGIIADELALDLYQIDLSRIVSKYVGETEKNLAQLFDAAEAGHAIILFDEADSLFAKRTEVKSSVDRYANLEVNYLLQRMEAFNGITILTTNLESSIDEAFKRRISFRVNFPFPESEERMRMWKSMLPAEAQVAPDIDFETLSEKYAMSGGYIRNAVLRAAFLAADEQSPISMRHLLRAATLEYTAMGKVVTSLAH